MTQLNFNVLHITRILYKCYISFLFQSLFFKLIIHCTSKTELPENVIEKKPTKYSTINAFIFMKIKELTAVCFVLKRYEKRKMKFLKKEK